MASSLRHIATEPANLNHKMNPERKQKALSQLHTSDSDLSNDTASLSQESQADKGQNKLSPSPQTQSSRQLKSLKTDWEILEGLKEGQRCDEKPEKQEGYLLKRRKWPMKGWHKRYFVLENGILTYAKTVSDMTKGKLHGEVDVGLSVISTKLRGRRIDIDAEESIYHLKVKARDTFPVWIKHLKHHRLWRQHEIAFGRIDSKLSSPVSETLHQLSPVHSYGYGNANSLPLRNQSFLCQQRVSAWLVESTVMDKFNKEFAEAQEGIFNLGTLLEQMEDVYGSSNCDVRMPVATSTNSMKRDRKRFLLKRKKNKGIVASAADLSSLKSKTLDLPINKADRSQLSMQRSLHKIGGALSSTSLNIQELTPLSTSNPNLPNLCSSQSNVGLIVDADSHIDHSSQEKILRENFICSAKETLSILRSLSRQVQSEKERLKQALDFENLSSSNNNNSNVLTANLRSTLNQALQQNAELRSRLSKIHAESDMSDCSVTPDSLRAARRPSVSCESSLSITEYFDAAEYISESSSEGSVTDDEDEGSFTSDNSETGTDCTPAPSVFDSRNSALCTTGRRTELPVPKPDVGDLNLWNLLCRNIGKDLSKISMPVTLNEPLNTLQRLCEELEYSDILDKAAETDDPFERMILVATFAVSAYGSSYYRAGHKPFNPLLGETFECIREDRGFKFISEQVSHHPPISACHAESKNYIFWQDLRIKTTFWGKSMEVQPIGTVHLILPKFDEHYRWNKLTTCIHNLFGGQRWVDLYGELCIYTGSIKCKLTFSKASYWSNKRHEVHGNIQGSDGKCVHNIFGKWDEALYCGNPPTARCIWRIGAIPEGNDRFYGFTRFAIELNELESDLIKVLPPTDTRFRPDQRLLEEGDYQRAETIKVQLEQLQRERKKEHEDNGIPYEPMWFKKTTNIDGKECWEYAGTYWTTRSSPGFANIQFPQQLW